MFLRCSFASRQFELHYIQQKNPLKYHHYVVMSNRQLIISDKSSACVRKLTTSLYIGAELCREVSEFLLVRIRKYNEDSQWRWLYILYIVVYFITVEFLVRRCTFRHVTILLWLTIFQTCDSQKVLVPYSQINSCPRDNAWTIHL